MRIKDRKKLVIISVLLYAIVLFDFNLGNAVMPIFLKQTPFGTAIFGYLMAFMYMGQFVMAPIWGRLSDQKGRWVLALSPVGYGIGQLMYVFSGNSFLCLLASRAFSGIFAILFLSQFVAFISDITPELHRKRALSTIAIMGPFGAGLAFLAGGVLNEINQPLASMFAFLGKNTQNLLLTDYFIPFAIQFLLGIALTGFIYFFIRDNNHYQKIATTARKRLSLIEPFKILQQYQHSIVKPIIFITFLNSLAYMAIQAIPYYLQDVHGFGALQIGYAVFAYNIISVGISLLIQPLMLRKFSDHRNLLISNAVVIVLALAIGFTHAYILIAGMSLIIVLNTLLMSLNKAVLTSVSDTERGAILGTNESAQSMGSIIGSFIVSPLYAFWPDLTYHRLPFLMMACVLLIVSYIIWGPLKEIIRN